ncbi:MAG: M20 family metallo-hydrolase [Treponema sp.]|nr:M20 family metallo-hydrolase [Treponema sp.]
MTERESVFASIDAVEKGVVELETLLSGIPAFAPESGGVGELEKVEALEKWLRGHGVSGLERFDSPDPRVPSGKRPNLVATIPGKRDDRRLWIMAHTDVVPEGDRSMWKSDPFKVVYEKGRLVGRGVEDNQQGLVGMVFAALALMGQGIVPPHTVKLLFVADEEVGSLHGIQFLLEKHGDLFRSDDLFVVPDGGSAEGTEIEVAEKNICWLKIVTKGKQTHAAMPDSGTNAFLAACDLALRIHELEKTVFTARDPLFAPDRSTINPTKKEANVPNVNTIPGDDVFYVDMRILPQYPIDRALAEISSLMRAVEAKHGVTVAYELVQRNESKATAADAPVVKALTQAIHEVYGVTARPIGIGGGTVAAYLRKAGYDAVVWARMDDSAHQPNEYALMKNILGDAKVFASMMLRE